MPRQYRALLSVHITAEDDAEAQDIADKHAGSLVTDGAVVGHMELIGELAEGSLRIARVVYATPQFRHQLPLDWTST
jgi:hypothetical protein